MMNQADRDALPVPVPTGVDFLTSNRLPLPGDHFRTDRGLVLVLFAQSNQDLSCNYEHDLQLLDLESGERRPMLL